MELLKKDASLDDVINKVNELVEQRNREIQSEIEKLNAKIKFFDMQSQIITGVSNELNKTNI